MDARPWRRALTIAVIGALAMLSPRPAGADRLALPGSHLFYESRGDGPPVVLIHGGNLDAGMWDADVIALATAISRHHLRRAPVRTLGTGDRRLRLARRSACAPRSPEDRTRQSRRPVARRPGGHQLRARPSGTGRSPGAGRPRTRRLAVHAGSAAGRSHRRGQGTRRRQGDRVVAGASLHGPGDARSGGRGAAAPARRGATSTSGCNRSARRSCRRRRRSTRLGEIRAPTLVLVGTLDVPDIQAIARRLTADIGGARLEVIDGVGHLVNLEAPDRFRALVAGFLGAR